MTEQQPTEQIKPKVTGKPFVKGDPRINRKGRPKTFDAFRALAQQIAHEVVPAENRPGTVRVMDEHGEIAEHIVTVAEAILRRWAVSDDPQLQRAFIEIAYGKVPQNVDVTSGGQVLRLEIVRRERNSNPAN